MTNKHKPYKAKPGWGYKALRFYVRLFHDYFYYSDVYWVDVDNIPSEGPVMIVSDHQNGLSDPLGFVMSVNNRPHRKLRMIARGDAFKPLVGRILQWLGMLPAFRSSINGEGSSARNRSTFEEAEEELIMNGTVGIYPEAGHQDKHWLGKFSVGYLHIVFEAARKINFEREIFIVPSCNHYSDYFDIREQMLIWYGEPVSAAPYYELYRTDPREAQQRLNAVIWQKVSDLMLNITDLDNYDSIDYLRNTYGVGYAVRCGRNPAKLPEKLLSDKALFAGLEAAKREDQASVQQIYDDTTRLKEATETLRIDGRDFDRSHRRLKLSVWFIILVLLSPVFLLACVPNVLIFYAPRIVTSKIKDRLQHSGINFGISVVLTMPVLYLITFALVWIFFCFPIALLHVICLPFLGIFAWHYSRSWHLWARTIRFRRLYRRGKLDDLIALRESIYERLDKVLA